MGIESTSEFTVQFDVGFHLAFLLADKVTANTSRNPTPVNFL